LPNTGTLVSVVRQSGTETDGVRRRVDSRTAAFVTGVLLAQVEKWDPPVPMGTVLSRIDPAENARGDFEVVVVRITAGEYETALAVATGRGGAVLRSSLFPAKELLMARVNTYLNFQGQTAEAFAFYAKTFGAEVTALTRYSDMPAVGPVELSADERNLVMHAELAITDGHVLMATDMLRSMGQEIRIGNNTTLCLDVDSREEADRLYGALSVGGSEGAPMADMPWGAYWGVILDRYGIRWMVNHTPAS
jgi:PhnB protein